MCEKSWECHSELSIPSLPNRSHWPAQHRASNARRLHTSTPPPCGGGGVPGPVAHRARVMAVGMLAPGRGMCGVSRLMSGWTFNLLVHSGGRAGTFREVVERGPIRRQSSNAKHCAIGCAVARGAAPLPALGSKRWGRGLRAEAVGHAILVALLVRHDPWLISAGGTRPEIHCNMRGSDLCSRRPALCKKVRRSWNVVVRVQVRSVLDLRSRPPRRQDTRSLLRALSA